MSFKPHLSFLEAHKLSVGDKVDHRNVSGYFAMATIIHKGSQRSGLLKIHYDGQSSKYDTQCSYIHELYRFASPGSISRTPANRLKNIKKGSFVDINIRSDSDWRKAEVVGCSQRSGQIQVQYLLDVSDGKSKPIKRKTWVHLNNTNEVDSFGTHTLTNEINHLPISLETKRAYLNIPNELKEACVSDIINNVYGGLENILSILIENASTSKLIQIQEIIKCKNIEINDENNSENDENNSEKKNKFGLLDLSSDSISYICGYLNREDIQSFKLTNYSNGIVCLREMTKCNVAISNINEIINDLNGKYCDELGLIIGTNYNYNRYLANMDYLSLRLIWKNKYNIPLNKQLLLSQNDIMCRFYDTRKNIKMNKFKIREIPTRKWLLFDKRNLIKFDEITHKAMIMNKCNEKKQCLIFIKWFDIYFQEIIPVQFVMGNRNDLTVNKLIKYIQFEFIATTNKQKEWYNNMQIYFKKMDICDNKYPKLICFKERNNKLVRMINPNDTIPWWTICILQLNTSHPAFNKYKFTNIKEKYNLLKN